MENSHKRSMSLEDQARRFNKIIKSSGFKLPPPLHRTGNQRHYHSLSIRLTSGDYRTSKIQFNDEACDLESVYLGKKRHLIAVVRPPSDITGTFNRQTLKFIEIPLSELLRGGSVEEILEIFEHKKAPLKSDLYKDSDSSEIGAFA